MLSRVKLEPCSVITIWLYSTWLWWCSLQPFELRPSRYGGIFPSDVVKPTLGLLDVLCKLSQRLPCHRQADVVQYASCVKRRDSGRDMLRNPLHGRMLTGLRDLKSAHASLREKLGRDGEKTDM
jgi:hypothetical protein